MKQFFIQVIDSAFFWLPALLGGFVDYFNQIAKKQKRWSITGFVTHLASALFFGWVSGSIASGLEYSADIISASGGVGGFFGVRVADLIEYRLSGAKNKPMKGKQ